MKMNNWYQLILAFALLVFVPLLWSQEWSTPIFISGGSCPDMDVDPKTGQAYVLSMVNGVTISRISATGDILEQEIVPGTAREQGGMNFGAAIAVDSQGFPHICYRYYDGDDPDGTPTYTAYYVQKTAAGWLEPLLLAKYVRRGYVIRLDVDEQNVAHIIQGFTFNEAGSIWGYVRYFRVIKNAINKQQVLGQDAPYIFRGDDRIEIISRPGGLIYILTGVPDPAGKIYYLLSTDRGNTFVNIGEIHSSQCRDRNGSPDLAADSTGLVHLCYGATKDDTQTGQPSVRYARFNQNVRLLDKAVTPANLLVDWKIGMGLGSIASDDSGRIAIVAFSEKPGGKLYTTYSMDRGESWNPPVQVASASGGDEGRNKHLLRSWNNRFFLVYPENNNIYLRCTTVTLNRPPIANAGGPYISSEGATIHFEASQSFDPDGAIVKYEWDWENNGSYDATSASSLYDYAYPDDYQGQVKLRVTDDGGSTNTCLAQVTVVNVPPVADANGPYHGAINQNIQCFGTATDAGKNDALTFDWDLDFNGSFETSGQDALANFARGGIYRIVLRVTDDDGGVGLDTAQVHISSQPPAVAFIPSQTILEGA
ncbi:MAG: PKD domain-containing protein, partial [candidate division KSB1 bacterium]|nr:PKD domain-containing protein [candidate division KSB1 bacterium]